MVNDDHTYAQSLIEHYLSIASNHFKQSFSVPTVIYKNKGRIAGTAHLNQNIIQINQQFIDLYHSHFLDEVIPHELAHLIVFQIYGRVKPHGNEWKSVMFNLFNKEPKRTHQFELPASKRPISFKYRCACQIHSLSKIRHNRIQQKQIHYLCKKCKQPLTQLNEENQE